MPWTFYPAFIATVISIVSWTVFAYHEHDILSPKPLSELGAARKSTLAFFRTVLWICGVLFAITMFAFITPRIRYAPWQFTAWSITFSSEMLLGVFPAMGKTFRLHDNLAQLMAAGMLAMAYIFCFSLDGAARSFEILLTALMTIVIVLGLRDRQHFIIYELSFIFVSHMTILIAALALL